MAALQTVTIVQVQKPAHVNGNSATEVVPPFLEASSPMAYVMQTRSAAAHPAQRGGGLFSVLGAALARRRVYTRTLAELRELTDRELADLGISRLSIADVAREAAYGR